MIGNTILLIAVLINTIGIIGIVNYDEKMKYLVPTAYLIDVISMLISLHIKNKLEQKELKKAKSVVAIVDRNITFVNSNVLRTYRCIIVI